NADKLVVAQINVGNENLQIVTAATNIKVGDIVPVAKDGAELTSDIKIKKGELRGVESEGMMCGIDEIGLELDDFPNQTQDGIMILPNEYEKYIGENATEVLSLREDILDFEITSNRPDCLSAEGLGREVAASLGKPFKKIHENLDRMGTNAQSPELTVTIEAPDLCYRYIGRIVKDVNVQPSPDWLKRRLKACGIRPINNIVDITNYVMLEMGQPMHAFDINGVEGKQIIVRRAKKDEKIITLDGEERILDENNLVIADEQNPVAVAGVMGGLNSEIEDNTDTIILESAVFNGGNVRLTAKKLGLRTESSSRYEKGLSAEYALRVVNRAIELIEEIGAGTPLEEIIDVYPTKQEQRKIKLEENKINALLGTSISKQEMIKILESLEVKVEGDELTIPYFRNDLENSADIAEEVLRMYGYDKLGTTLIDTGKTTARAKN
ncbi:MAG: phenylalanine--tRNA ligase subunit beta, partial [Oscillospiraceae bacterium]|nr:phenylalanine--tRNA ligase subunit beta [Oscillospiraceae bacterium]